jgi:hypothetical protein
VSIVTEGGILTMSLFTDLSANKGTVSSALGKALAQKVLQEGRTDILQECIDLSSLVVASPDARSIGADGA